MPTKGVLDYQRLSRTILHIARVHAQEVDEHLRPNLAEVLEDGETLPDIQQLQLLFARVLEKRLEDLMAAEEALAREKDDDRSPRVRRAEACAALRKQLSEIRAAVRVVYGANTSAAAPLLAGSPPEDPLALHQFGAVVLERLRQPAAELNAAGLFAESAFNLEQAADALQPKIEDLGRALSDVRRERSELESARTRRNERLLAFEQTFRGVGRALQGWCLLAGLPELANRIRLTPPKRHAVHRGTEG